MSHTNGICAAAVTRVTSVLAVGIDLERDLPLDIDLEGMVCTTSEQAWIRRQDPLLRGRLGKIFFSAKEAFYKCQYGLTRTFLDFADVELKIDMETQTFQVVRVNAPFASIFWLHNVWGRFGYSSCHLATVAVVDRDLQ